jgi:hypothetical protein
MGVYGLRQESDQYVLRCVYRGWRIQQYCTAVDGHRVRISDDEGTSSDWAFGKDIQAQKKALDWFMCLVASLQPAFSPHDYPSDGPERSPAGSRQFAATFNCEERDAMCAR